ncbi:MAG TPA: trypsin-like peptidase domain-containing protein, partial [Gemmatimonadota bacterium]|nr:trypsin-like peptidase domain-containing protein [Gemmatimonadota bacterium]
MPRWRSSEGRRAPAAFALLGLVLVAGPAPAAPRLAPTDATATVSPGPSARGDTLERVAARATDAVVRIDAETSSGPSQGSGFLVDSSGRILTNYHVIRKARSISVKLTSADVYDNVQILGTDQRRDIAVLQVAGFHLPALPLGNSDSVRVGATVVLIGSPLGLENTVSTGIVSGRRQEPQGYQLLQVSAPASPGSSGGPVLSGSGRVVGIA